MRHIKVTRTQYVIVNKRKSSVLYHKIQKIMSNNKNSSVDFRSITRKFSLEKKRPSKV